MSEPGGGVAGDSPVLAWVSSPAPARGIRFLQDDETWREHPYDEVAWLARVAAQQIGDHGSGGPVAAIVLPSNLEFISAFYGAQLAGMTPSPIAPPGTFADLDRYRTHAARVLALSRPGVVITDSQHVELVREVLDQLGRPTPLLVLDLGVGAAASTGGPLAELALLQFTSGSSASPKGVRITWDNLKAAVTEVVEHEDFRRSDHTATWVPLHHDLGLIDALLGTVTAQNSLSLVRPDQFVRSPVRWLRGIEPGRPTATFTAGFGFGYAAARVTDDELATVDLSDWVFACFGGERADAGALNRFARRFSSRGFRPEVLCPGYGMAEATVPISSVATDRGANAVRIAPGTLRPGGGIDGPLRRLADIGEGPEASEWLVGSGHPCCGGQVRVVDGDGIELGERVVGELVVSSPTVADGYLGGDGEQLTHFHEGALFTGDAGFIIDGQVFVIGRMGDAMSARGRTVYLEDVEASLGAVDGIKHGRAVVIAGPDELVALVEQEPGPWVTRVHAALVRHLGSDASIRIRSVERGAISRTTSGKPRRRAMWDALLDGTLPGQDLDIPGWQQARRA